MLLDIVDNLPRLRLSSSQFKIILWLLKQCHIPDVPSYDSFHKLQSSLRTACGSEPTPQTSSLGNKFSINDVRKSVAKVFNYFLTFCDYEELLVVDSRTSQIQKLSSICNSIRRRLMVPYRKYGRPVDGRNLTLPS